MKSSNIFATFETFIGSTPSKNGFIFVRVSRPPPKMQFPQRHGKKWYEGESHYILLRVKQGIPPSKIAKEVSRTTNGITSQLKRLEVSKLIQEVASLRSRIEVLERRNKPAGNGLNAIRAVRAGDEYLN
jgi:hypothetical protein